MPLQYLLTQFRALNLFVFLSNSNPGRPGEKLKCYLCAVPMFLKSATFEARASLTLSATFEARAFKKAAAAESSDQGIRNVIKIYCFQIFQFPKKGERPTSQSSPVSGSKARCIAACIKIRLRLSWL